MKKKLDDAQLVQQAAGGKRQRRVKGEIYL